MLGLALPPWVLIGILFRSQQTPGAVMDRDSARKSDGTATKRPTCDLCQDTGLDLNDEPCPFGCEPLYDVSANTTPSQN